MGRRLFLIAVVIVAAAAGAAWWWARASLPLLDGEYRVSGLAAPVEILFDGHGVPHVYASGPEDAWFVAGVLHARDRLWQMELYRRAAHGRLSEMFGEQTLPIDRRFLTLDLRRAAEAEWRAAPPVVRDALSRYAAGVSAHIADTPGRRRPIEFQILGITPAPWTPVDSLVIGRLLAWRLAENHQAELVRHALAAQFGGEEALRLGGRYPDGGPSVMQGPAGPPSTAGPATPTGLAAPPARLAPPAGPAAAGGPPLAARAWPEGLEWLRPTARRGGSNNWVIAGRRTASGRPLLANDPHLEMEFPGVWYEMHLVAAGLDVIGVTVPGTPFVVLGHNARIAWGMTNTGADVQDLVIERIDLNRQRYFSQGQWLPLEVTRSDISVKGGDTHSFEVWRTRNGTIFAEVGTDWELAPDWLSPAHERRGERRAFTLRWDAAGGEMAGAFEALNRAGTWNEFTSAVERFTSPSQNVVYADIEGNIGYAMSGVLPQRSSSVGTLPLDGTTGAGYWSSYIPTSALPRLFNPERGYITSSNNLIDRQWPGLVTRDWAAPYRAIRLQRLMMASEGVDLPTAAAWQTDVTGMAAADVLSTVDGALAHAARRGDTAAEIVLQQLRAWDRQIDNRPVVTLYHLFEHALWRRTFFDEMGEPLFSRFYEWAGAERPAGLYAILDEPNSRWFDDIATLDRRETRDDIFVLAAADAADGLGGEFSGMSWADAHRASFTHPMSAAAAPLRWLFNRGPAPMIGDIYTVNRSSYNRLTPFVVWEVPSWRQLFDVGQWDDARVVLPAGQSGHPLSPYYFDQNELWRRGEYRQQPFSRGAVEAARAHRLVLTP
ncbi:MAG TPA: penicillin acylase family protein [Vicinamibacterales bacterium]|nr:penicillin acylase family protein [Vicinamibacterales bacterium]